MNGNDTIEIPARNVKVADSADICIVGGSCTGVFAAVRAARLGAKVILVEQQNRFGGVATCGLVGMWHSVYDITGEKQVIGGLTFEKVPVKWLKVLFALFLLYGGVRYLT